MKAKPIRIMYKPKMLGSLASALSLPGVYDVTGWFGGFVVLPSVGAVGAVGGDVVASTSVD